MSQEPETKAVQLNPLPVAKAPILVGQRGIEVKSLDDLWRVANIIVASGSVPKNVETPEQAFVALQYGLELGFSLMRSLSAITVINGRASLMGNAALAVLRSQGLIRREDPLISYEGEGEKRSCTARIGDSLEYTFSVADAKKAGLWGKTGPWTQHPDVMLRWRAIGFMLNLHFSDVLMGLPLFEEARDFPPGRASAPIDRPAPPQAADPLLSPEGVFHVEHKPMSEAQVADPIVWEEGVVDAGA